MSDLVRFGVSIEEDLLKKFDERIHKKGYKNRSEALRDLIRSDMVTDEWVSDKETAGTITLVYDHHTNDLGQSLTHIQHSFTGDIISVLHVHLDHHNCMEVLVVKGRASLLQALADQLTGIRGVKYGKLSVATTGALMTSGAAHHHDARGGHSHSH